MKRLWESNWFKFLAGLIIISFIGLVITMCVYFNKIEGHTLSSEGKVWAEFGDFLSGTTGLYLGIINVCVTIVLAFVVNNFTKDIADRQLAFHTSQDAVRWKQQKESEEIQLRHQQEIVKLQLRYEAVKDLKAATQKLMIDWSEHWREESYLQKISLVYFEFASNNQYLFPEKALKEAMEVSDYIDNLIKTMSLLITKDYAKELQTQISLKAFRVIRTLNQHMIE